MKDAGKRKRREKSSDKRCWKERRERERGSHQIETLEREKQARERGSHRMRHAGKREARERERERALPKE